MLLNVKQQRTYTLELSEDELTKIKQALGNANYYHNDTIKDLEEGGRRVNSSAIESHQKSIYENEQLLKGLTK